MKPVNIVLSYRPRFFLFWKRKLDDALDTKFILYCTTTVVYVRCMLGLFVPPLLSREDFK